MTKASTGKRVKAYVLIETAAGKAKVVKKSLSRIKSGPSTMVHLDGITGPFDFIAIVEGPNLDAVEMDHRDRKSTRLNSSHVAISYAVFCLKKKSVSTDVFLRERTSHRQQG